MTNNTDYSEITRNGLWSNNAALVQLLGLCPLLAVSGSVVNALGLGLATLVVLMSSNFAVSLIRSIVSDAIKLPAFVMIIAAFTTCIELLMQAFTYELYQILGIFIPLIVTNCAILGRADAYASKNPLIPSIYDGFTMGLGFLLVLVVLGGIRELLGTGVILADMHLLFGPAAANWRLEVFPSSYPGLLVAILPPGAFIITGLLIALKNTLDAKHQAKISVQKSGTIIKGAKRVRTTELINS